jgi:hypothetical protein
MGSFDSKLNQTDVSQAGRVLEELKWKDLSSMSTTCQGLIYGPKLGPDYLNQQQPLSLVRTAKCSEFEQQICLFTFIVHLLAQWVSPFYPITILTANRKHHCLLQNS